MIIFYQMSIFSVNILKIVNFQIYEHAYIFYTWQLETQRLTHNHFSVRISSFCFVVHLWLQLLVSFLLQLITDNFKPLSLHIRGNLIAAKTLKMGTINLRFFPKFCSFRIFLSMIFNKISI